MDSTRRAELSLLRRETRGVEKALNQKHVDPFELRWAFEAVGAVAMHTDHDDIRARATHTLKTFAEGKHALNFIAADVLLELPHR